MNHGWGRHVGDPPSFEQRLGIRDCDSAIGELVLRGDVARLFAPSIWPFAYNATLEFQDGRRVVVRVFKAAGAGRETRLGDGWREICEDYDLVPGDVAVFTKAEEHGTFFAGFIDADGNDKLRRLDEVDPPSSPEFLFDAPDPPSSPEFLFNGPDPALSPEFLVDAPDSPWSPEFQGSFVRLASTLLYDDTVNADWVPAQGAEVGWGEQAAGAADGGGNRALQGVITIEEAMDLAAECGAREGSDEHYMATRLFVKAENRAMFLTFRTNAGRLQWLRRCYEDWMN